MNWQDIVFTVGLGFIFLSTFPMLLKDKYPPLSTSVPYGVFQMAFVAPQVSYENWMSALLTGSIASLWLVLAYIELRERKGK